MKINRIANNLLAVMVFAFLLICLPSCEKDEGEGGRASISGQVYAKEYNQIGALLDEYYSMEERVYIEYGGESDFYDDVVRTDYQGRYRFEFLYPGTYRVYAYSNCLEVCPGGVEAIIQTVEISSRKEDVEVPLIEIRK